MGRPASADDRRRELPGLPRGDHGPRDDAGLPRPGRALRRAPGYRRGFDASSLRPSPAGCTASGSATTEHQARTVILAMGAEHKKLGVPGEEELSGGGISYCATCDAAFFKDQEILVIGGGDSAMEEAIFLAKFGSKVTVIHRRDEFRASKIMLERAREQENLEFLTPYVRRGVPRGRGPVRAHRAAAQRRDGRDAGDPVRRRVHRDRPRAAVGDRRRPGRPRRERLRRHRGQVHADEPARASSRPATSSTTPTARPSPRPERAVRRRSTPSGTCATRPRCRRPRACRWAISPRRSGSTRNRPPRRLHGRAGHISDV